MHAIVLRPSSEIARRAVCFGALDFRGRFERTAAPPGFAGRLFEKADARAAREQAAAMATGVTDWVRASGAWADLFPAERELLERKAGSWTSEEQRRVAWGTEWAGSLLWTLAVVPALPAFDADFDGGRILPLLPFLAQSPFVTRAGMPPAEELAAMLDAVRLRDATEIVEAREGARRWLWRSRTAALERQGRMPESQVREVLDAGVRSGHIDALAGDFVAFGRPFGELDPGQAAHVGDLAMARLHALSWATDPGVSWDDADLST